MNRTASQIRAACVASLAMLVGGMAPAHAADLWVAYGTGVTGYTLTGSGVNQGITVTGTTTNVSGSFGGFTNAFSLTTDTPGNVYVGDAGANRVLKFDANGVYKGAFGLPTDSVGGNINPQQIEIDGSGNLYTVNYSGAIYKFSAATVASSIGTAVTPWASVPGARGVVIKGDSMWVSTSSSSGAEIWKLSLTNPATRTLIYTTGIYPDGQLRGMDVDATGILYFADSTWSSATGKIEQISSTAVTPSGTATVLQSNLQGPNAIVLNPTVGTGGNQRKALYVANYFDSTVKTIDFQGNLLSTLITGLSGPVTGLALSSGIQPVGDEFIPELSFFVNENSIPQAPEPGTWVLLGSALLLVFASKSVRMKLQPARARR